MGRRNLPSPSLLSERLGGYALQTEPLAKKRGAREGMKSPDRFGRTCQDVTISILYELQNLIQTFYILDTSLLFTVYV